MKLRAKITLFATAVLLAGAVAGCPNGNNVVPDTPPPSPNPDVKADCASACKNIGPKPDGLGCEEGEPTADGQTCQQVCESMPNTTQDYLDCAATITACEQLPKCPH